MTETAAWEALEHALLARVRKEAARRGVEFTHQLEITDNRSRPDLEVRSGFVAIHARLLDEYSGSQLKALITRIVDEAERIKAVMAEQRARHVASQYDIGLASLAEILKNPATPPRIRRQLLRMRKELTSIKHSHLQPGGAA